MVGGAYLQLQDGMMSEYIAIPLNTSLKGWNSKWFYIRQEKPYLSCDVDQVPVSNKKWSVRPNLNGMEQVKEILTFMDSKRVMVFVWR